MKDVTLCMHANISYAQKDFVNKPFMEDLKTGWVEEIHAVVPPPLPWRRLPSFVFVVQQYFLNFLL